MTVMAIFLVLYALQLKLVLTEVEIIPAVLIHEEHVYEVPRDQTIQNNNFRFIPSYTNLNSNPVRDQPQFKAVPEILNEKLPKPNQNVEPPPRVPSEPLVSNFHPIDSRPPSGLKPSQSSDNLKHEVRNIQPIRLRSQSNRLTTPRSVYRPIDSRIPAGIQPPPPKSQDLQTSDIERPIQRQKMRTYYPQTTKQPFLPINLQNVNFYYPQTTIQNILRPNYQNSYPENVHLKPNLQQHYTQQNYPRPFQESNYALRNQGFNRRPNLEPNYQKSNSEQRPILEQRPNLEQRPILEQRPNLEQRRNMESRPNSSPYGPSNYVPNNPIKTDTTDFEPLGVAALNHALITVLYENRETTRNIRHTDGLSTYKIFASKYLETTTIGPPYFPINKNSAQYINIDHSRRTTIDPDVIRGDKLVTNQFETSIPRVKVRQKSKENKQERKRKNNPPRVISSQFFQMQT